MLFRIEMLIDIEEDIAGTNTAACDYVESNCDGMMANVLNVTAVATTEAEEELPLCGSCGESIYGDCCHCDEESLPEDIEG